MVNSYGIKQFSLVFIAHKFNKNKFNTKISLINSPRHF